jgi:hypothetical protein
MRVLRRMIEDLTIELADVAKRLSSAQVKAWSDVLNTASGPRASVEAALIDAQVGGAAPGAAEQLVAAWRRHAPHLPGAAVALGLASAAVAYEEAEKRLSASRETVTTVDG